MGIALWLIARYQTTVILEFTKFAHDNSRHLYIPATVVDNGKTSKFANFGTVWPFLYHLTLVPLVISNYLYRTGLAGSILNSIFVATTMVLMYKIVQGKYGLIASLLFGVNIYSCIHASSSYMIPLGQFLAVFSTFYVYDYIKTGSGKSLTKAVFLLMLSTLARYESWPMVFMLIGLVVYNELKRGRSWRILSHTPLAFFGIIGWIVYNWVIFGNPLEFITHPSPGASGYYFIVISKIIKPWTIDFKDIGEILIRILGPFFVLLFSGIIDYLKEKEGWQFLLFLLSSSVLFLAEGPELLIKDHLLYYYFSFPFLFIIAGRGLSFMEKIRYRNIRVFLALLLIALYSFYQISEFSMLNNELIEGSYKYYHNKHTSDEIKIRWGGEGYILYSSILGSYYFSVIEGVKPKYILDEYDFPLYERISLSPWEYNVSVVVFPDRETYTKLREYFIKLSNKNCYVTLYYENESWRSEFLSYYKPISNSPIKLYDVPVVIYVRSRSNSFKHLTQFPKTAKI
ncbi:hypothetical protein [Thermococcus sp.]